jgi:CMP-N-acetylneuraminic acid synthetase
VARREELADVAKAAGAEVPFMRPAELSGAHAATMPVIAHALTVLADGGFDAATACCIYPAAPFVTPNLLRECHEALWSDATAQYAFPVITFGHPVQRGFLLENGAPRMLFPEHAGTRSQDLPEVHHDAGQLYFGRATAFREQLPLFAPHSRAVPIARRLAVDIDTADDLAIAEALHWLAFPEREARE